MNREVGDIRGFGNEEKESVFWFEVWLVDLLVFWGIEGKIVKFCEREMVCFYVVVFIGDVICGVWGCFSFIVWYNCSLGLRIVMILDGYLFLVLFFLFIKGVIIVFVLEDFGS